ncbi:MAG: polysaccharide deacetylase family protein [Bacteroidota bacterium]|nr:polysaccharide deacetylase family protein [Bacteroidota bacterium]
MKKIIIFVLLLASVEVYSQVLKQRIPDRLVVLTFDDAVASQYTVVAPLLKQFGFGATFFVCEFPTDSKDSTIYMNWQQIRALNKMGFEVANHTRTHVNVSKITEEQFNAQLNYIEDKCESLGIEKPTNFAYPGYDLSYRVQEMLQGKGYEFARAGGSRAYDPLCDYPLQVPSWATNAINKDQIMQAFGEARNGKIVVLTIHGVPDVEHPWVNTPPELFKQYLQYLSENKFKVISLRDLNSYINIKEAFRVTVPDLNKQLRN